MRKNRNPEQQAADEALTAAVDAVVQAYGYQEEGFLNTDYVVLINQVGWDDEGDQHTGIVTVYKDGEMPWMNILGLLRMGTLKIESTFQSEGRDYEA